MFNVALLLITDIDPLSSLLRQRIVLVDEGRKLGISRAGAVEKVVLRERQKTSKSFIQIGVGEWLLVVMRSRAICF